MEQICYQGNNSPLPNLSVHRNDEKLPAGELYR